MTDQPTPVWIDGHPLMEAIAAAVFEQCEHHDSGLVLDDPRNIAAAAYAAITATAPRREQLPDDVLAVLSPRSYLSTACDTARRIDAATIRHPERADLPAWVERLHAQCPLTREYTGEPCYCRCHTTA